MRRAVGLPVFNEVKSPCACPVCTQRGVRINVLLHLPRCPRSPAFHSAHGILAQAVRRVCDAAGARPSQLRGGKPGSSELIGLRSDATRPSDVTWLNFFGTGRHLLIDVTVASLPPSTLFPTSNHTP